MCCESKRPYESDEAEGKAEEGGSAKKQKQCECRHGLHEDVLDICSKVAECLCLLNKDEVLEEERRVDAAMEAVVARKPAVPTAAMIEVFKDTYCSTVPFPPRPEAVRVKAKNGNGAPSLCQFCQFRDPTKVKPHQARYGVMQSPSTSEGASPCARVDSCKTCVDFFWPLLDNRVNVGLVTLAQQVAKKISKIRNGNSQKLVKNEKKEGSATQKAYVPEIKVTKSEIVKAVEAQEQCAVCGIPYALHSRNNGLLAASMDRIDPRGDYELSNLLLTCQECNDARKDATCSTLLYNCALVAANHLLPPHQTDTLLDNHHLDVVLESSGSCYSGHKSRCADKNCEPLSEDAYYDLVWGPQSSSCAMVEMWRCFYCKRGCRGGLGVDRRHNQLGYSDERQVLLPCCSNCNHLRGERTLSQFFEWCWDVVVNYRALDEALVHKTGGVINTDMFSNFQPKAKEGVGGKLKKLVDEIYKLEKEEKKKVKFTRSFVNDVCSLKDGGGYIYVQKLKAAAMRPSSWYALFFFVEGDEEETRRRCEYGVPKCLLSKTE